MASNSLNRLFTERKDPKQRRSGFVKQESKKFTKGRATYIQPIYPASRKMFIETYLTKKGKRLMSEAKTEEQRNTVREKYQKNRYRYRDLKPLGFIRHRNI